MSPSAILLEMRVADTTATVVRYAPFQEIRSHAHAEEGLTIVLDGTFLEESRDGTMLARTGSVSTRPCGLRYTNRSGPDGAAILGVIPDRERFQEPIRDWARSESPTAFRAALRLIGRDEDALTELLATIPSPKCIPSVSLERVRRVLDESGARPSVSSIAESMAIHPVHLARQFRQAYGVSLREYRTMQLVKHAIAAIVSTKAPLSRVAHDCGFADHSHMCRAFRRVAGWESVAASRFVAARSEGGRTRRRLERRGGFP